MRRHRLSGTPDLLCFECAASGADSHINDPCKLNGWPRLFTRFLFFFLLSMRLNAEQTPALIPLKVILAKKKKKLAKSQMLFRCENLGRPTLSVVGCPPHAQVSALCFPIVCSSHLAKSGHQWQNFHLYADDTLLYPAAFEISTKLVSLEFKYFLCLVSNWNSILFFIRFFFNSLQNSYSSALISVTFWPQIGF